jgi:hypothetical protein
MRYLSFTGHAQAGQTPPAWIFAMKSLIHGDDMPWKPTDPKPTVIALVILLIAFIIYRLLRRPRR